MQTLYRIEFFSERTYGTATPGPVSDKLLVDVYEHWLEPA